MSPTNYFSFGDLILPSCIRVYFGTKTVSAAVEISFGALKTQFYSKFVAAQKKFGSGYTIKEYIGTLHPGQYAYIGVLGPLDFLLHV